MPFNVLHDIWWFLIMIGVMILIHELGHYWAARFFDVKVDTFSFGFGPRLFGFRKGETDFRFSLILLGGYVKMAGEQPGDEHAADPRSLQVKPRWQRLIILFAGPAMNIVLAVAVLTGLFMVHFPKITPSTSSDIGYIVPGSAAAKVGLKDGDRIVEIGNTVNPTWEDITLTEVASADHPLSVTVVRNGERKVFNLTPVLDPKTGTGFAGWGEPSEIEVGGMRAGSPAAQAGLLPGDIILSVDGQPIHYVAKVHDIINGNGGKPVDVVFSRSGKTMNVHLTPARLENNGAQEWLIGVTLQPKVVFVSLPFPKALSESVRENAKSAAFIYRLLRGIVERRMSPKSVLGPIKIVQVSGEGAREGPIAYLGLMAALSLNLAVVNLLPIPILDGGTILMLLIEMFMRRDLSLQVKEAALRLGFVFIMALVAFVIYNDISKLAG
jgi:regulator of sigma E protease